ncbi:PREDICTED: coiled-coil domain-containing protein 175-like [Thamnophis sirtalis]|uniref:Coiled-coil domain-containing protein 175-like n=1 Tax=Thamnophis sirtalis TaxID=35019 RepID=A0A6I9Y5H0_9SAUR|nr:PREDICTED: coiled-coil domain-containing protein 175-like [Thamnophis sirtalis]
MDDMQDIYDSTHKAYARELAILEETLKKESDKREMLQIELDKITALYENLLEANELFLSESKQTLETMKKSYNKLKKENDRLDKEIKKYTERLKHLTSKLQKKTAYYKKHEAKLTTEIGEIEEEYDSKTKRVEEIEEKLQKNVPLAEELQKELEELSTDYAKQKEVYNGLQDEENALKVGIEYSLREIKRLERQKEIAKDELQTNRDTAFDQMTSLTCSIKFIERDNYEIDRMIFILNGENARLRAGIEYLKEDISAIDVEAKTYQLKRQQIQQCTKVLYELFIKKWKKEEYLQELFLKYRHELLIILEEYVRRGRKRNIKVDYVHEGLQLNYEEMDSLLRSKYLEEADKDKTDLNKLKLEY